MLYLKEELMEKEHVKLLFHQCFRNGFKISNAYRKDCVEKTQPSADRGCEPYNNINPGIKNFAL